MAAVFFTAKASKTYSTIHFCSRIDMKFRKETNMKRTLSVLMTLSLAFTLMAGCSAASNTSSPTPTVAAETPTPTPAPTETPTPEPVAEPVDVNVLALKGPTAMGMVEFMNAAEEGKAADSNYSFTIVSAIDEVAPKLIKGEADIAAIPANLSSVLYNNTQGGVKVLAINTLGVLYILQNGETVSTVEDLRGKTIYASGKGATPEYALNYILTQNGIDPASDVTIEWKSEHAECLAALTANKDAIAMLPQPFVTTAQAKVESIRVALDLTQEWDKLQANAEVPSALITGVVVARAAFVEENPEAVKAFLDHYKASVEYVNANVEEASALVEKYDIVPAAVAVKALPKCNIAFIEGSEMKAKLSGYLSVLFGQNPKSVGGALPDDAFYFSR